MANGLGNLTARVSNLLEKNEIPTNLQVDLTDAGIKTVVADIADKMKDYRFNDILQIIWEKIKDSDETLSRTAPWKMSDRADIAKVIKPLAQNILNLACLLEPFLPLAARQIQAQFSAAQVRKGQPLFPRL